MKLPVTASVFCAALSLATPLLSQTFTRDDSSNPALNTYTITRDYQVGKIIFNRGSLTADNPWVVDPVSLRETTLTTADGEITAYDFCSELFVIGTGNSTYSTSEGFGPLNAVQQIAVRKLVSNTLNDFIALKDTNFNEASVIGSAIQVALWEVIEDGQFGVAGATIDEDSAFAGELSVKGYTTGPPTYSGKPREAIDLAESYLAKLRSDSWEDLGGFDFHFADAGSEQNRIWVTVIPEPSVLALSLASLGFLFLRKRN